MILEPTSLLNISLAALLSFLIGAEREYFQKSAGIRTHTLVGLGAALFTVVSKYGFPEILSAAGARADPSRVAAQVVSGVGFLGAGLIFVRRDSVRGLTTAASIWLVSAVGMAAGAGMFIVAPGVTLLYLIVTVGIRPVTRRMPHATSTASAVRVTYEDGRGILRTIMETIGSRGVRVGDTRVAERPPSLEFGQPGLQEVQLSVFGSGESITELLPSLRHIDGVHSVRSDSFDDRE